MNDNDKLDLTNTHDLVQQLVPTGVGLRIASRGRLRDMDPAAATFTLYDEDSHGRRPLSRRVTTVGEFRQMVRDFTAGVGWRPFMTATGVDEQTDVEEIAAWGLEDLELGFLYSARHAGRQKRYPSWKVIREKASQYPRCALHVCGGPAVDDLERGDIFDLTHFQRVQVNGSVTLEQAERLCAAVYPRRLILQGTAENGYMASCAFGLEHANLDILIDASGGNGILPEGWPTLNFNWRTPKGKEIKRPVGFAGGLHRNNMEEQVRLIRKVAQAGWWVDLESGLRDEEWFSWELLKYAHMAFRRALEDDDHEC